MAKILPTDAGPAGASKATQDSPLSDRSDEPTLATVYQWFTAAPDPIKHRERDIRSALETFARVLDRPLEKCPTNGRWLNARFREIQPAEFDFSKKRWQNIASEIRYALDHFRGAAPPRQKRVLQPEWALLRSKLATKRHQVGLCQFVRYCSDHQIAPNAVDDTVLATYREYLDARSRKDIHKVCQDLARIWNEVASQVQEWPATQLTVPRRPSRRYTLPWSDLPASLNEEVDRHLAWLGGHDLLQPTAPPKILRPRTVDQRRLHLQILASAAVHSGFPTSDIVSLATLTSEPCVRAALAYFQTQRETLPTSLISSLLTTVRSTALHWPDADKSALEWLAPILRRVPKRPPGLTPKNRETLRQFDSQENVARLLHLPSRLVEHAHNPRLPSRRQAIAFQLALAIEILLVAPVRINNLCTLRLDHNLRKPDRRARETFLVWGPEEVKNDTPLEYSLPDPALGLLEEYLREYRPRLAPDGGPWLFPGRGDGPKKTAGLAAQIRTAVLETTGLRLTPHQFRHIGAKLFLDKRPGEYEVLRRVLGHSQLSTTLSNYVGLEAHSAVRHFDAQILELREALPRKRR